MQCFNNHPIMKIYFQIIFKFTWYTSSALTVKPQLGKGVIIFQTGAFPRFKEHTLYCQTGLLYSLNPLGL